MSKFNINEAFIQALQEQEMKEARSHKEDNEKASPRQNVFDRNKEGVDQGVYDEEDTRNIKDRYREPLYARRNKVRKYQDNPKGKDMQDRLNKTLTHIDYEKSPNEKTLAYKKDKRQLGEAVALKERKNYSKPVWHTYEVDGYTFDFKCLYYEVSGSRQASLWGHEVELKMDYKTLSYYKIPYYNRTWETFTFQSCMLNALSEYMRDVANDLLNKHRQANNIRAIKQDQKDEILASNEWYQTLTKLYNQINNGDKGKIEENKQIKTESKDLKFKLNDIVEDTTGVGKILEIDQEHPEGLIYGVLFMNNDLPYDYEDIGLYWCEENGISLVTDENKIKSYNDWYEDYMTNTNGKFYYNKKENKQVKTEGQLWGDDREYDKKIYKKMQGFVNQLVKDLTSSGWDYDDSSAKYGTYRFKKGSVEVKYCDNFDKVGIAEIEAGNTDILKSLAKELEVDYYEGEDYITLDFRWGVPDVTDIIDILNKKVELKTEDYDEENNDIDDDSYDETISLLSIAYRDIPKVGVEDWGKDDELKFLIDTREFITYFDDFEVEIPKKLYDDASSDDWTNGVEEYLDTFLNVNIDNGKSDNTYNWGARLTHDMEICIYEEDDCCYVRASVHKSGDVRGNYTNDFLLRFDDINEYYEAIFEAQSNCKNQVELDGKHYTIEPDFFSEYVNIWCEEDNDGWDEVFCENIEQLKEIIANKETNNY